MFFAIEDFKLWLFVPKGRSIDAKPGDSGKGQQNYILPGMLWVHLAIIP